MSQAEQSQQPTQKEEGEDFQPRQTLVIAMICGAAKPMEGDDLLSVCEHEITRTLRLDFDNEALMGSVIGEIHGTHIWPKLLEMAAEHEMMMEQKFRQQQQLSLDEEKPAIITDHGSVASEAKATKT